MRDIESILGLCASTGTCNKHKCESCDVRNPLSQQLSHSLDDASAQFSVPARTRHKRISTLCDQSVDPFSKLVDSITYNLYMGGTAYHKAAWSSRAASPRSAAPLKSVQQQQQQLYSASLTLSRTLTVVLTRAPQCVTQGTTHHPSARQHRELLLVRLPTRVHKRLCLSMSGNTSSPWVEVTRDWMRCEGKRSGHSTLIRVQPSTIQSAGGMPMGRAQSVAAQNFPSRIRVWLFTLQISSVHESPVWELLCNTCIGR